MAQRPDTPQMQGFDGTFEDWATQRGYRYNDETGNWSSPDGETTVNPRDDSGAYAKMQQEFAQDQSGMYGAGGRLMDLESGSAIQRDGKTFRQIGEFADGDSEVGLQRELALLISGGVQPIYDPQYGWIAEHNAAFDKVHDPNYYANNESFLSKLFTLGPILIPALMTGSGALAGLDSMAAGAAAGGSGFTGAGAADLAMEIAPGMTVAEGAAGLTAAEQAAIASNFGGGTTGGLISGSGALPESYWNTMAENAASGTATDAAAVNAGTFANTAVDTAINAGGLDDVLGNTIANYTEGMGANNLFTGAASSWGWLDAASKWAKDNQLLASTGLNVAGGLIKGALTPSPEEQAKALADAKVDAETRLANERRANNNLTGLNVSRLRPSGRRLALPGLINNGAR